MATETDTPERAAEPAAPAAPTTRKRPKSLTGLWFILPFFVAYGIFLIWPTILGLYYSFTDRSLTGRPVSWVGFDNWAEAIGDERAWAALKNTAIFTLYSTPPLVILALILALLAHRARRMGWFVRLAFFAPFVIPVSVVTTVWIWMYQPDGGLINHYLNRLPGANRFLKLAFEFGPLVFVVALAAGIALWVLVRRERLRDPLWLGASAAAFIIAVVVTVQLMRPEAGYGTTWNAITDDPSLWLHDTTTAMWSVVLATVWWTIGFNFLLYLAALQTIPSDIYEAARMDGANWWQQLWGITLPLLGRTTALVVVLQLIASLRIFDQIYLMTGGGPLRSTEVAIQYIYISGFEGFRIGYASALSYVLFVLILVVSIVQFRLFSRKEG